MGGVLWLCDLCSISPNASLWHGAVMLASRDVLNYTI